MRSQAATTLTLTVRRLRRWGKQVILCFGATSVACAGAPKVLPPREPPPPVQPYVQMPSQPVQPGYARVVLDAVDQPMRVAVRYDPNFIPPGGRPDTSKSGPLCVTPCVADLPTGRYRLYLSSLGDGDTGSGDTDDVEFSPGYYVYLRAPGRYETPSQSAQVLPVLVMTLGLTTMLLGSLGLGDAYSHSTNPAGGYAVLALGLGGTIGGAIWWYDSSRAIRQEGATSLWRIGP